MRMYSHLLDQLAPQVLPITLATLTVLRPCREERQQVGRELLHLVDDQNVNRLLRKSIRGKAALRVAYVTLPTMMAL